MVSLARTQGGDAGVPDAGWAGPIDSYDTWTVNGTINAPNVTFTFVYTGINAGYWAQVTGTVDATGAPTTGVAHSSEAQTLLWTATRRP